MFINLNTQLLRALKPLTTQLYPHTLKITSQPTLSKTLHFPIAAKYAVISESRPPSFASLKKVTVPPLATYSEYISSGLKYMNGLDTKAAHRLFQKALKLSVNLFGEKSKNAAVCLNYLAQNSQLEGNVKNSLKFYNEALSIASDSSQLNYLLTSDIHHDINIVYQRQGNLLRAKHHAEVALKLLNEHFPEEYKRQSLVLQSLGHISTQQNDLGQAKEHLFESFDILAQNGEDNTPEFRLLCDKIANLLEKEGNHLEAIKYRKEALRITDDHLVAKESLFSQYLNLAALYSKLNKDDESVKCLEKAYEHLDNDDQSQHDIHRGPLLVKIGHLHLKAGKKSSAVYNLQEGLKYLSKDTVHGQKMVEKAERMLKQAKMLKSDDEMKLDKLRESLNVMMESSVSYNLEDAEGYRELGYTCIKEFDEENAQKAFIRALQIFVNIKGPDCEECVELKKQLKDYDFN